MEDGPEKLKTLFNQWRDVEPSPTFKMDVWKRIRAAESEAGPTPRMFSWISLRQAFPRAYAAGLAATLAIVAGLLIEIALAPHDSPAIANLFAAFPDSGLSASFIRMHGGRL